MSACILLSQAIVRISIPPTFLIEPAKGGLNSTIGHLFVSFSCIYVIKRISIVLKFDFQFKNCDQTKQIRTDLSTKFYGAIEA